MTKERLRRYRDQQRELEHVWEKIETLEAALFAPKAQRLTGMPAGPSKNRNSAEDLADRHVELLDHYNALAAELAAEQLAIEQAIASLESVERDLMRYHYIDGLTWPAVCERINYGWTQTHRIHARALLKLKEEETAL